MAFKPAKSRSLALVRGKIRRDVFFDVAEQRIPTVSEEPVKSLGRVFDESLTDKSIRGAILQQTIEGLQAIEAAPLQGRFKVWLFQFVLLPRLLWPLTIYEIGLSVVEKLERKVNRYTRKWLGLPPALSSVALYSRSTSLRLPLRSIVEEYKLSKIITQWMLNNSADSRIREVKPLLRSGRKFRREDRLQYSNALKADKYADLTMDLEAKGYRTDLFPIEVGARGVVGRSTYRSGIILDLAHEEPEEVLSHFTEAGESRRPPV